jgi:hypothetical protein
MKILRINKKIKFLNLVQKFQKVQKMKIKIRILILKIIKIKNYFMHVIIVAKKKP